jgi:hypothetical protein
MLFKNYDITSRRLSQGGIVRQAKGLSITGGPGSFSRYRIFRSRCRGEWFPRRRAWCLLWRPKGRCCCVPIAGWCTRHNRAATDAPSKSRSGGGRVPCTWAARFASARTRVPGLHLTGSSDHGGIIWRAYALCDLHEPRGSRRRSLPDGPSPSFNYDLPLTPRGRRPISCSARSDLRCGACGS